MSDDTPTPTLEAVVIQINTSAARINTLVEQLDTLAEQIGTIIAHVSILATQVGELSNPSAADVGAIVGVKIASIDEKITRVYHAIVSLQARRGLDHAKTGKA